MFTGIKVDRQPVELLIFLREYIEIGYSTHLHDAIREMFDRNSITWSERSTLYMILANNIPFWYKVRVLLGIEDWFGYDKRRFFLLYGKTSKIKYLNKLIDKYSA